MSGANINAVDEEGNTPLHLAAQDNGRDTSIEPEQESTSIEILVAAGANIEIMDRRGNTPLHLAVKANNLFAVHLLLSSGANIEAVNGEGDTPKQIAQIVLARGGNPAILEALNIISRGDAPSCVLS
jgi:ankyrin repeat protein